MVPSSVEKVSTLPFDKPPQSFGAPPAVTGPMGCADGPQSVGMGTSIPRRIFWLSTPVAPLPSRFGWPFGPGVE